MRPQETTALYLAGLPACQRHLFVRNHDWTLPELRGALDHAFALRYTNPAEMGALAACTLEAKIEPRTRKVHDLRARALGVVGNSHRILSLFQPALLALDAADEERLAGTGNRRLQAMILEFRASLLESERSFDEALRCLRCALDLRRASRDTRGLAKVALQVGVVLVHAGRPEAAIGALTEALSAARGDVQLTQGGLMNLATCLLDVGRIDHAEGVIGRASPLFREADSLVELKLSWLHGRIAASRGQEEKAVRILGSTRQGYLAQSMPQEAALVSLDLGIAHAREGRREDALREAAWAEPIFRILGGEIEATAVRLLTTQVLDVEPLFCALVVAVRNRRRLPV